MVTKWQLIENELRFMMDSNQKVNVIILKYFNKNMLGNIFLYYHVLKLYKDDIVDLKFSSNKNLKSSCHLRSNSKKKEK